MMKLKGLIGGFVIWACLFVTGASAAPADGNFAMVVNVDNEVSTIGRTEAELMFLGKNEAGQMVKLLP